MKNKEAKCWDVIMTEYKELPISMRIVVRETAVRHLQSMEVEEIGSSDVNCEIVNLYNSYGGFDEVVRHGLELVRS